MSFDGPCYIKLNNASPDANSCAFSDPSVGVSLVKFDGGDRMQKWTIRPEGPLGYYTIQDDMGLYVIPKDDHLAYGRDSFVWIINGGRISTPEAPKLNWIPSDNGEFVILTPNSTWTWTISPA